MRKTTDSHILQPVPAGRHIFMLYLAVRKIAVLHNHPDKTSGIKGGS